MPEVLENVSRYSQARRSWNAHQYTNNAFLNRWIGRNRLAYNISRYDYMKSLIYDSSGGEMDIDARIVRGSENCRKYTMSF